MADGTCRRCGEWSRDVWHVTAMAVEGVAGAYAWDAPVDCFCGLCWVEVANG